MENSTTQLQTETISFPEALKQVSLILEDQSTDIMSKKFQLYDLLALVSKTSYREATKRAMEIFHH